MELNFQNMKENLNNNFQLAKPYGPHDCLFKNKPNF